MEVFKKNIMLELKKRNQLLGLHAKYKVSVRCLCMKSPSVIFYEVQITFTKPQEINAIATKVSNLFQIIRYIRVDTTGVLPYGGPPPPPYL